MSARFDFGMVGLGTMGKALLLNMASKGNAVAGFDIDAAKANNLVTEGGAPVDGFTDVAEFVASIRRPRAIMILVPAGPAVDSVIANLRPHLEPGDFVIDGGNSYFKDTDRRLDDLAGAGFGFMGMGVSGGERGARTGPSMMPGGTPEQYERVRPILESIAAHADGVPCVARMGARSAGHYVKTVHNGIEYAMMQLIAEVYGLLLDVGHPPQKIADVFQTYADSEFGGYLLEITAKILRTPDDRGDGLLVEKIADRAKAKGTGKWTSQDAMDLGVPIPTIDAAVSARIVSAFQRDRLALQGKMPSWLYGRSLETDPEEFGRGLSAAMLLSYVQGLHLIRHASDEYGYGTDLRDVVRVWRAGCIIRSKLLAPLAEALEDETVRESGLVLHYEPFLKRLVGDQMRLRWTVEYGNQYGIPVPAHMASVGYLDGFLTARSSANLIQAQRDLFGAHTYERTDGEGNFHTDWDASRQPDADRAPEKEEGLRVTPKTDEPK